MVLDVYWSHDVVIAAQTPDKTPADDKPMKVQLVGPITVDGVGAIVNHTVKRDGIGGLPVSLTGPTMSKRYLDVNICNP